MKRYRGVLTAVGLLGVLPAFTNIRLAALQPVDFVLLLLLGFSILKLIYSRFSFRISSGLSGLFWSYSLLLLTLILLSALAFRLAFYPLDEASFLKQPVIFSLSKLLQLTAIICGFLWLTNVFLRRESFFAQAMTVYWRTGIVCSLYAILSYLALLVFRRDALEIFGAYSNLDGFIRARGFFNEGGPFGIYIVSVFIVGLLRRHITGRRLGAGNLVVVSIAFLLSASKVGFLAAAFLGLYAVLSVGSFWKRTLYVLVAAAVLFGTAVWLDLGNQLLGYLISYENIQQEIALRGNDYNLVVGRVSALYIVPRMIANHPLTGIGYGNYPLMRNDPLYLGPLPAITEVEDLPALGVPAIAAEMGIPATVWLMLLLFAPYWLSRGRATILVAAALFQPFAHALAVQLTFFYPWFVSACAIAASCYEKKYDKNINR